MSIVTDQGGQHAAVQPVYHQCCGNLFHLADSTYDGMSLNFKCRSMSESGLLILPFFLPSHVPEENL